MGTQGMKFSFSVFFLGWWLTRQRWMATTGQNYPKPSISVSPSVVVARGGNFTILCKSEGHQQMEFLLHKAVSSSLEPVSTKVAERDEVLFPIVNARLSDGGIYTCIFKRVHYEEWSDYSDEIHINIREQFHPKPSISVSSQVVSLGGDFSICCKNEEPRHAEFYLIKEGASDLLQNKKVDGDGAVFPISNAKESDAGIYWCDYGFPSSSDQHYSYFSDRVYINITDPSLNKPSLKVRPKGQHVLGANVIIHCQGPEKSLNFSLYKSKDFIATQMTEPDSNQTRFLIFMSRREDAGNYTCQYHLRRNPFVWSKPSNPVRLVMRDPSLSKPSIKVRPRGQHALGMNVTIECQGPEESVRFLLLKSKVQIASQKTKPDSNTAEFPLLLMTQEDAGDYTCQYHRRGNPFVWSEPSDPVELFARDENPNMTIVWASGAAGLLILLLLLLAFILYRKRIRGSTANERNQPVNVPLEPEAEPEADPDGVSYAVLSPYSFKAKQAAVPKEVPESCVYASVAKHRTKEGQ